MTSVPVTHTFSSRNKEAKDLADGNALKTQQKEILEREIRELGILKAEMVKKTGYTPQEYEKVEKEHLLKVEHLEDRAVRVRIELGEVEGKVSIVRDSLSSMTAQEAILGKKIETMKSDLKILSDRKIAAESAAKEAETKYEKLIADKSRELTGITDAANKTKEANSQVTRDMEKRIAFVVEQERTMSIHRNDLEIYEARLRRKYPNDPIIV